MENRELFSLKFTTNDLGYVILYQYDETGNEQEIQLHPSQLHQVITWLKKAQWESMSRNHSTPL